MNFVLVVYTVVAMSCSGGGAWPCNSIRIERDYRPIGEFETKKLCKESAELMGYSETQYRCLPKR